MRPLLHVSYSEELTHDQLDEISYQLEKQLGNKYDIVLSKDLLNLYVQDPEILRNLNEKADLILEFLRMSIKENSKMYVVGVNNEEL